jgi:hypothetical protein
MNYCVFTTIVLVLVLLNLFHIHADPQVAFPGPGPGPGQASQLNPVSCSSGIACFGIRQGIRRPLIPRISAMRGDGADAQKGINLQPMHDKKGFYIIRPKANFTNQCKNNFYTTQTIH